MIDIKSLYTATTADLTAFDMSVLCEWRYGKKTSVYLYVGKQRSFKNSDC